MRRFKSLWGLGIPAAATVILMALISSLYYNNGSLRKSSVAAFNPADETVLSDSSLVDDLSGLPLKLHISQADWDDGTLSVDLKVTEEPVTVQTVYKDLAEMLTFSFVDKANVDQLYLRFMAVDQWTGARYLLLAANVSRGEWDPGLLEELRGMKDEPFPERMVQAYRLTQTNLWLKQFSRE
ncbi:hypothetical protein [Paenibacillus sp. DMB20]|uniref:hypothetical protein n=1 Tax=Paenibacillus sp. DMB20 TaxID=1642570 RepID=UPI0006278224|nr:hypothetical protein [Paenibacillus sp. DMB20]KKO52008.1 hypothetical protein XI25_21265 [Paenibacillus sp. DMB20]